MFSMDTQSTYNDDKSSEMENILDVVKHAGVNVLWLDNNLDSKGVASRVDYQSYKTSQNNPVCDVECTDIGTIVHRPTS